MKAQLNELNILETLSLQVSKGFVTRKNHGQVITELLEIMFGGKTVEYNPHHRVQPIFTINGETIFTISSTSAIGNCFTVNGQYRGQNISLSFDN